MEALIFASVTLPLPILVLALLFGVKPTCRRVATLDDARQTLAMESATLLTIVTLNVFQTFASPQVRYPAIASELTALAPEIATFQEVKVVGERTSVDGLLPGHIHRSVQGPKGGYRQGIVSRYPVLRTFVVPFRNNRSRVAVGAVIGVPSRGAVKEVLVLTIHLDYQLDHVTQRRAQMQAVFAEAAKFVGPVVVTGDFNFGDGGPEADVIPKEFIDVFRELHPDDPGYTWDRKRNPMADKGSLKGESSRRLDRIYVRGGTPVSSRIVFDRPINPKLHPSDHFGLVATLRLQ